MILKIKDEKGWYVVDNIEELHYQIVDKKEARNSREVDYEIVDPNERRKDGILLDLKKKNYEDSIVLTDFPIYLCNDNGKTIEKIYF